MRVVRSQKAASLLLSVSLDINKGKKNIRSEGCYLLMSVKVPVGSASNFQSAAPGAVPPSAIVLQIDVREHKLFDHIRAHPDQHPHTLAVLQDPPPALPIGDIILKIDGEPVLVIERKTLADLLASVKDGRYRDQKGRLLQSYPRERLLYVLEANTKQWSFKQPLTLGPRTIPVESKIVTSSLINLLVRDRIAWIPLQDLEETAAFIEQTVQRVREKPTMYAQPLPLVADAEQRPDTPMPMPMPMPPPMARKDQITPESCFRMQLAQIPGVSYAKAQAIADTLGVASMRDLMAINDPNSKELTKALLTVPGIGKKLAQSICVHLGLVSHPS